MERWCELLFPLYSVDVLYLSEDSNSHQSFPSAPLEAARFTEKHKGLLRHSKVQSNTSYTVNIPSLGTFRWWNSFFMKTCCLKDCECVKEISSWCKILDPVEPTTTIRSSRLVWVVLKKANFKIFYQGHPHKMSRFPSPDQPNFFGKK